MHVHRDEDRLRDERDELLEVDDAVVVNGRKGAVTGVQWYDDQNSDEGCTCSLEVIFERRGIKFLYDAHEVTRVGRGGMAQLEEEKVALTEASTALVAERDSLLAKVVELEASLARVQGSSEESLGELREKLAAKDAEAEALQKKLLEAKTELARSQPSTARASDGAPFDGLEEDDEDAC